jgi:hypothetical protein
MNKQTIQQLALANGFKLKEQPDGSMDLNPYVYEFASILAAQSAKEAIYKLFEVGNCPQSENGAGDAYIECGDALKFADSLVEHGNKYPKVTKNAVLRAAAEKWLLDNSDKDPQFSAYGTMIFDENEAAEEIGEAIIKAGEEAGFDVISPEEIVAATLMAKASPHFDDVAVDRFADAMKVKLAAAREKGRSGWDDKASCSGEYLASLLVDHLSKGNAGTFEDVANFAMMLHQRGEDPQLLDTALSRKFSTMCVSTQWLSDVGLRLQAEAFKKGFIEGYEQCSADEEAGDWTDNSEQLDEHASIVAGEFAEKLRQQAKAGA